MITASLNTSALNFGQGWPQCRPSWAPAVTSAPVELHGQQGLHCAHTWQESASLEQEKGKWGGTLLSEFSGQMRNALGIPRALWEDFEEGWDPAEKHYLVTLILSSAWRGLGIA